MLRKKMLRTLLQYKAQFISMIIMISLGVGMFTGFNMEWFSLDKNTAYIFDETGFADYRIYSEEGFSSEDLKAVEAIDGIERAGRYLTVNASVKDSDDVIAIAVTENPSVSGVYLMEGEEYDETSEDGLWLSDKYAEKNGIEIGDEITLTYKMLTVKGTVRGLVKASEFLICVPDETQLMPDYNTYGFAYISPVMLKNIIPAMFRGFIGDNLYYQINVITSLEKQEMVDAVDETLGKTLLVISKDETISYAEAMGEINEGKTMGSILPVLFLAIAVLTMVTTMHRITASEKTQIGTFKALGFRDIRIIRHYSCYALVIGIIGSAVGVALGYLIGWFIMNPDGAMGTYIDMPEWKLYVPWFCWLLIIVINLIILLVGYLSVCRMLGGTAAEALQPYTPKRIRHLALEETKAFKRLGFGTKWNLRDLLRHKARLLMTLLGITGCMILLVGGLGMRDTADKFVQSFYEDAMRYDNCINLDTENADNDEALALAEMYDGDWCASSSVQLGDQAVSLDIYEVNHDLIRFVDGDMKFVTLADDGAYVCARIAKDFDLSAGDEITFSPYGSDDKYTVRIAGIVRSMSESIIMNSAYAKSLNIDYKINSVYTNASDIGEDKNILNVQTRKAVIDSFDTFMQIMNMMIILLVVAAILLSLVVLYNLGIMSYTERYREMATLKVVGFRDRKIAGLLITQNVWVTVVGIIIGIPLGVAVLQYLLTALASEYEMKLAIGPLTYATSILLTFLVSLIVGFLVARKNRSIDMVSALKTQE